MVLRCWLGWVWRVGGLRVTFLALMVLTLKDYARRGCDCRAIRNSPLGTHVCALSGKLGICVAIGRRIPHVRACITIHIKKGGSPTRAAKLTRCFRRLVFGKAGDFKARSCRRRGPLLSQVRRRFRICHSAASTARHGTVCGIVSDLDCRTSGCTVPGRCSGLVTTVKTGNSGTCADGSIAYCVRSVPDGRIRG